MDKKNAEKARVYLKNDLISRLLIALEYQTLYQSNDNSSLSFLTLLTDMKII